MRINKVKIILFKELEDVSKSKYVLYSIIFMPIVFGLFIPATSLFPMLSSGFNLNNAKNGGAINFLKLTSNWSSLTPTQQYFIMMTEFSILLFLLLPMILPTVIAADSFSGEKDRNTAEGLVAAPLTESEIYMGKVLVSIIPATLAIWITTIPFIILVDYVSIKVMNYYYLPNLSFFIIVIILGPLLCIASTNLMIWVSTRTDTSRDAQQLGSLISLPLMVLVIGTIGLAVILSDIILYLAVLLFLLIDIILIKFGINLLNREKWIART